MEKYNEALKTMCRRCISYEMCQGTGCGTKRTLEELVDGDIVGTFAEMIKAEFYQEFDEIIPSIMADKIDELVKDLVGEQE